MRIRITKTSEGKREVLIIPGRSTHLPPRLLSGPVGESFEEELAGMIEEVARAERGASSENPL